MEAIDRVKKALPTSRHAEMLFDSVLAQLGERAHLVSAGEGKKRTLHVLEDPGAGLLAPWPLMQLVLGGRGSYVGMPGAISDRVPEESGAPPSRLGNLQGGEIEMHLGQGSFLLTYAADGQVCETTRTGVETVEALAAAVAAGGGNPVDLIARVLVNRDLFAEAPGRLVLPADAAVDLGSAWRTGRAGMRRALFEQRTSSEASAPFWIAADGYSGTAVSLAATRKQALELCRRQVRLLKPMPPQTEPGPELTPEILAEHGIEGAMMISAPPEDVERGPATIDNAPIALTQVPALEGGSDHRVVLLDDRGRAICASLFERADGLDIVGQALIDDLETDRLPELTEPAIAAWKERCGDEPPWPSILPPLRSRTWLLELEESGELRVRKSSASQQFDPGHLDGALIEGRVLRELRS